MVDSAVVGGRLLIAVAVACIGIAAWRFAGTGDRPLLPLAGAAAAFGGVFIAGQIGGYFEPFRATTMATLSLLVAVGLAIQWYRER